MSSGLRHCRTCFIKLEECNDSEDRKKFVLINDFPNVEHLMRICLEKRDSDFRQEELDGHAPHICILCQGKWEDFSKHYCLAIKSDEKLRKILRKKLELEETGLELNKRNNDNKFNEVFIPTEAVNSSDEVEKYETASPFYQDSPSNTSITFDPPQCEGLNIVLEETPQLLQADTDTTEPPNPISFNDDSSISDDFDHDNDEQPSARSNKKLSKSKPKRKQHNTVCIIKRKYETRKSANEAQALLHNNEITTDNSSNKINKKLRYHCVPCKKFFYEICRYEGHIKQVHEGVSKPYRCLDCDKTYSKYKNLVYHMSENHSEKSQEIHKCECNKTFKTKEILRQHMRKQHADSNKDPKQKENSSNNRELTRIICDQCGFMAAHQYTLTQHIKNKHTEAKKIKCEQCPKMFKSQSYLKYHMLSHNPTSTKPFQCTECPMSFSRRTLLNIHKRTHLKYAERLKCDFEGCAVRFVKPADKRLHMRLVHLKVKQHVCDFCGEAFGAMQTLRHHRYIHTGERPYKCNVCGQGFRQHTAMKTHRKAHFGKEERVQPLDVISNLSEIDMQLV